MIFSKSRIAVEFSSIWIILFFAALCPEITAQWTSNIKTNKLLVTECKNPININAVTDLNGGGFIVWQDKIDSIKSNVFFQHFDEDGILNFRSEGKPVSRSENDKVQPQAAEFLSNNTVVLWKEKTIGTGNELFVQRVKDNGELLWGENGLQVTNRKGEEKDPSLATDADGNAFVVYVYEDYNHPGNYGIYLQKFNSNGIASYKDDGVLIYKSTKIKTRSIVKSDEKGGCYVFWLESNEGKNYLYALHVDMDGQFNWGKRPVVLSNYFKDVFNYYVQSVAGAFVYVVWEINTPNKDIVHQLISRSGKFVWRKGGDAVTNMPGSQSSPHAFYSDSTITVSWINEINNDKDIYIQKFTVRGKPIWNKDGLPVIRGKGNQTGQRMISDKNAGSIVAWFDIPVQEKAAGSSKDKKPTVRFMAQRIDRNGKRLWDSTGVQVAASPNSEKSYLFLLPVKADGAIAVFKDKRSNKNSIYGQKILGSGRFIFELLSFNSTIENGAVKLTWQTKNEQNNKGFYVERATSDTNWQKIQFISGQNIEGVCSYEFVDHPITSGVNYYRLMQVDNDNIQQKSRELQVKFLNANAQDYTLMQNMPNPFSDSTYIRYYLPEESSVELEIFNDKIETIVELVDEVQPEGEHSVVFHARTENGKLPDGIYYYRIKALPTGRESNDFVDVKKMVISR